MASDWRLGAIVVIAYRGGTLLERAVESCERTADEVPLVLVDNSPGASAGRPFQGRAHLLPQEGNIGFAAGSNAGMREALLRGAPAILLLNEDAELEPGSWVRLVETLESSPRAGAVQPAIMRPDGTVNSLGNPVHRLGFAWAGGDGLLLAQAETDPALPWLRGGGWRRHPVEIPTFSGAAVLLRADALREVGLFEDKLYSYYEDVELSLRMRRSGWTLWLEGRASVIHHHDFKRNPEKFRLLEKNRLWVLLAHLRLRTLVRLAPFLAGAELAVLLQAARQGWLRQKLAAYPHYVPTPRRWLQLLNRRQELSRLSGGPRDLALFESATWRLPPRSLLGAPAMTVRWKRSLRRSDTLVMVPARNDRDRVERLLRALREEVPGSDLLVIDNGSSDGTRAGALALGAQVLRLPFDLGVGGAMRAALRYAVLNDYHRAVRVDPQHHGDAATVAALLASLDGGADLVIASRYLGDGAEADGGRPLAARLLGAMLWFATGRWFTDASSTLRAFSRPMLEFFAAEHPVELLSDSAETTLAASAAGFTVLETAGSLGTDDPPAAFGYHYVRTILTLIAHALPRRRGWSLPR